jgi:hypothetical protein
MPSLDAQPLRDPAAAHPPPSSSLTSALEYPRHAPPASDSDSDMAASAFAVPALPHPVQAGLAQLARDLALPDAPRSDRADQTFGLVFDVLERATPTVATLGHFLTGVAPGSAREQAVVVALREQVGVLDTKLARMAAGGAG